MKWIDILEDDLPPEEGLYFVCAPTADRGKPLYGTAWWNVDTKSFVLHIPSILFSFQISHWLKPQNPNEWDIKK